MEALQALEQDVQALRREEKERLVVLKQLNSQRDHMSRLAAEWELKLKYATQEAALKDFVVQVGKHSPNGMSSFERCMHKQGLCLQASTMCSSGAFSGLQTHLSKHLPQVR